MNACERYEADLSALLDGELDPAKEEELRAHMAGCAECTALYETFSLLHEDAQEPPADLAARIMSAVRSEAEAAEAPAPDNITPMPKRKKRWIGWAAAAACFVIILGAVTIPRLLHQRPDNSGTLVRSMPQADEQTPDAEDDGTTGDLTAPATSVPDSTGTSSPDSTGTSSPDSSETPAPPEESDAPQLTANLQPLALSDAEQVSAVRALLTSPAETEMPGETNMPILMLSDAESWTAIWVDGNDLVYTDNGTQFFRCADSAETLIEYLDGLNE